MEENLKALSEQLKHTYSETDEDEYENYWIRSTLKETIGLIDEVLRSEYNPTDYFAKQLFYQGEIHKPFRTYQAYIDFLQAQGHLKKLVSIAGYEEVRDVLLGLSTQS